MGSFLKDTLITKDPPDHRKLRNLVNQAFTPRAGGPPCRSYYADDARAAGSGESTGQVYSFVGIK